MVAIASGLAAGFNTVLAGYLGEKNFKMADATLTHGIYLSLLCAVIFAIFGLTCAEWFLHLFTVDTEVIAMGASYIRICTLFSFGVFVQITYERIMQATGNVIYNMILQGAGALINIILDPVLIYGYFGFPQLGVAGAAIATVLGNVCADIFYAWFVIKRSTILSMKLKGFVLRMDHVKEVLRIGIPGCVTNLMQSIGVTLLNRSLLPYGNEAIAAMGIVLKVSMIALLILTGLAFGGQPLYGYYFGRGDKKRLSELFRFTLVFILSVAVVLTVLIIVLSPFLMGIFMDAENIIKDGTFMLRAQVITMPLVALVLLFTIIFQSAGKVAGSFVLSISRQGVIFLIVLVIGNIFAGYIGVMATQAVSDIITSLIAIILFRVQLSGTFRWKSR